MTLTLPVDLGPDGCIIHCPSCEAQVAASKYNDPQVQLQHQADGSHTVYAP